MPKDREDFKYNVDPECDHVFDERNNSFLALRKVQWGESDYKLEIRKWFVSPEKETAGKGTTFLTEKGPHTLASLLVQQGFGDTKEVLDGLKNREDFIPSLQKVLGHSVDEIPKQIPIEDFEEYYDPKTMLLG